MEWFSPCSVRAVWREWWVVGGSSLLRSVIACSWHALAGMQSLEHGTPLPRPAGVHPALQPVAPRCIERRGILCELSSAACFGEHPKQRRRPCDQAVFWHLPPPYSLLSNQPETSRDSGAPFCLFIESRASLQFHSVPGRPAPARPLGPPLFKPCQQCPAIQQCPHSI